MLALSLAAARHAPLRPAALRRLPDVTRRDQVACWSPTAARSPAASSAPRAASACAPSRCSRMPTPTRATCAPRTRRCAWVPRRRATAISTCERMLAAARASGAEAIHPGYGFLSENAQFAQACADAGLIFVGPPARGDRRHGLEDRRQDAHARGRRAGAAGLRRGGAGPRQPRARGARRLGCRSSSSRPPAAAARACRSCASAPELAAALAAARRLAESAFGDGALLLERYLPAPRHVEVQVFADTHGHYVHLGDRDCSVQRRHQKLIEEAPAPNLPDELRARLRAAARGGGARDRLRRAPAPSSSSTTGASSTSWR